MNHSLRAAAHLPREGQGLQADPRHDVLSQGSGSWDAASQQGPKCQARHGAPQAIHSALHPLSKPSLSRTSELEERERLGKLSPSSLPTASEPREATLPDARLQGGSRCQEPKRPGSLLENHPGPALTRPVSC